MTLKDLVNLPVLRSHLKFRLEVHVINIGGESSYPLTEGHDKACPAMSFFWGNTMLKKSLYLLCCLKSSSLLTPHTSTTAKEN